MEISYFVVKSMTKSTPAPFEWILFCVFFLWSERTRKILQMVKIKANQWKFQMFPSQMNAFFLVNICRFVDFSFFVSRGFHVFSSFHSTLLTLSTFILFPFSLHLFLSIALVLSFFRPLTRSLYALPLCSVPNEWTIKSMTVHMFNDSFTVINITQRPFSY